MRPASAFHRRSATILVRPLAIAVATRPAVLAIWVAILFALAIGIPSAPLAAAERALDPDRLRAIPERLQTFVEDGTISGAVALVARRDGVASVEAVGQSDLGARRSMRKDDLFWIASMTKPITATAVLILEDEGKLSVEDPVEKHLPEFRGQRLIVEQSGERLVLGPSPRPITLRDLLTHTSGISEGPDAGRDLSLAERTLVYSQQPLRFAPGSRWEYSNAGINTLGRIVERVSGVGYAEFLETRILRPLGMKDTTFWPTPEQAARLARSYEPGPDGKGLRETAIFFVQGELTSRSRTPLPAGGLFSTAEDLSRFYRAILRGGELDGIRIVSRAAVERMTRLSTGELVTGFTQGMGFGLGWAVVREPRGTTATLSPGSFGHGGAYGTQGWIDPAKDLILVLMIQRAKLPNADDSVVRRVFQEAAVGALAP